MFHDVKRNYKWVKKKRGNVVVYEAEDNHVYGEGVTKTSSHHRVVDYFPVRAHCQTFLSWRNYYDL